MNHILIEFYMMIAKLAAARAKIDLLDRRIAALLARRFALAAPLKSLKKNITDKAREKCVLANARRAAGKKIYAAGAAAVFAEIIRQSKKLQGFK
jgi:chorismate mutase